MAKRTFLSKTYAANSFACGTFRGIGLEIRYVGRLVKVLPRETSFDVEERRTRVDPVERPTVYDVVHPSTIE